MQTILTNIILAALLTIAVASDLKTRRIPNAITLTTIVAAILINAVGDGTGGILFAVKGCAAGALLLLLPFAAGGIGGGDVKMLAAVGALKGASFVFAAFLLTAIAGGIIAAAVIIMKKDKKAALHEYKNAILNMMAGLKPAVQPTKDMKDRRAVPYAVAIAAGTTATFVLTAQIL